MIISGSYFKSIIDVPNADNIHPNSNLLGNKSLLDNLIEQYERDILIKTLTYHNYKEFQSNLEVVENATVQTVKSGADQKWKDLFSGKEYQIDGVNVLWPGIVFKEVDLEISFIAYWVYCKLLKEERSRLTGIGMVSIEAKGAKKVSSQGKYLESDAAFYELVVCGNNGVRSLYQFIEDMNNVTPDTYPHWQKTEFKRANQFGI